MLVKWSLLENQIKPEWWKAIPYHIWMNCLLLYLNPQSFFTTDLESAYHKLALHPDSRDLKAFIIHEGLFQFCRVHMGDCFCI